MEINAKVTKGLNQIVITKKLTTFSARISTSDAKRLHETGRITKSNKCFQRLVDNDFDVTATLAWYQEERERLARERNQ